MPSIVRSDFESILSGKKGLSMPFEDTAEKVICKIPITLEKPNFCCAATVLCQAFKRGAIFLSKPWKNSTCLFNL